MLSRRVFLLSTFAACGLPLLSRSAMAAGTDAQVLVLCETRCADTRHFAASLPVTGIEADPSAALLDLQQHFVNADYEMVLGLSRDAAFVLVEQYAQAAGYQCAYQGLHQYREQSLQHSLQADVGMLARLQDKLQTSAANWSSAISAIPGLMDFDGGDRHTLRLQTRHACPQQSPGQLVSWLFRRAHT